jgi:Fur family ferric uptake transcriptional regulator
MITIGHCPIEDYENSLQKTTDFDITGHKLEVYGYCPQCKNKK